MALATIIGSKVHEDEIGIEWKPLVANRVDLGTELY